MDISDSIINDFADDVVDHNAIPPFASATTSRPAEVHPNAQPTWMGVLHNTPT